MYIKSYKAIFTLKNIIDTLSGINTPNFTYLLAGKEIISFNLNSLINKQFTTEF